MIKDEMRKEKEEAIPRVICNGKYKTASVNEVVEFPGTTDAIFYNLLHHENIAARIISLLTNRNVNPKDISYSRTDYKDVTVRDLYMDIHFLIPDMNVNLEMQRSSSFGNPDKAVEERMVERLICHSAALIQEESKTGSSKYIARDVYVVCFFDGSYNIDKWCVNYQYTSDVSGKTFDDTKLTVVLMKNRGNAPEEIRRWLDLLLSATPMGYKGDDDVMNEAVDVIYSSNSDSDYRDYLRNRKNQEQCIEVETKALVQAYIKEIESKNNTIANAIKSLYKSGSSLETISSLFQMSMDAVKKILGL